MIELLSRQDIFKINKRFAAHIVSTQDAMHNPIHNPYEEGMMYDSSIGKGRYYGKEEIDEMNAESIEAYNNIRDVLEWDVEKEDYKGGINYNLPITDINEYAAGIGVIIDRLLRKYDWGAAIFLMIYPAPWLLQDNDYPPAKAALKYFEELGMSETFAGGIRASGAELAELMKHLFWLCRCNVSLQDCYFSGEQTTFTAMVCKYGNIHFYMYSDEEKQKIMEEASIMNLIQVEHCSSNFSESSVIEGRTLPVDYFGVPQKKPWWKFWK